MDHSEPECCEDGRIRTVVELDAGPRAGRHQRMVCIATLELDGTVSCIDAAMNTGKNMLKDHR